MRDEVEKKEQMEDKKRMLSMIEQVKSGEIKVVHPEQISQLVGGVPVAQNQSPVRKKGKSKESLQITLSGSQ